MTSFEMLYSLVIQDGWEWRPWVPLSQRRRKHGLVAIPDGYVYGEAKLCFFFFCSAATTIDPFYLRLLLTAEVCRMIRWGVIVGVATLGSLLMVGIPSIGISILGIPIILSRPVPCVRFGPFRPAPSRPVRPVLFGLPGSAL